MLIKYTNSHMVKWTNLPHILYISTSGEIGDLRMQMESPGGLPWDTNETGH